MKKRFMMFTLLATAFSGMVHADDAAIRQSLAKLGVQSTEIQPAPVAGMKTVLTNSGVLYVTEDGKHIIQGPMYDVSGASPVNVTNQLLMKHLNALENEMIVYKAPQEKHVITVFTDITCGYCHKLHEEMRDYNALGITVRYLAFPRQGLESQAERTDLHSYLIQVSEGLELLLVHVHKESQPCGSRQYSKGVFDRLELNVREPILRNCSL